MTNSHTFEDMSQNPVTAPVFGCVLAGGQSRRMGDKDKPFIEWQGVELIQLALSHLSQAQITHRAISSSGELKSRFDDFLSNLKLETFTVDVVVDDSQFANQGPLVGLLSALRWAYDRHPQSLLYTCPVDTPLLTPEIPSRLLNYYYQNNYDAVIAAHEKKLHPIIGVWRSSCHETLAEFLQTSQKHSFHAWLSYINSTALNFDDLRASTFLNINTPSDLSSSP